MLGATARQGKSPGGTSPEDTVSMSMTVTMASVAFWSWVLGPLGAVLAIPLSLLMKAIFIDSVPSARWLAGFVDSGPRRGS